MQGHLNKDQKEVINFRGSIHLDSVNLYYIPRISTYSSTCAGDNTWLLCSTATFSHLQSWKTMHLV